MSKDEHIQRHLELCQRVYERLVAEGKWPWPDSPGSAPNGTIGGSTDASRDDLPPETMVAIRKLAGVLRRLHRRLSEDGYELVDGRYRLRKSTTYEQPKQHGHSGHQSH